VDLMRVSRAALCVVTVAGGVLALLPAATAGAETLAAKREEAARVAADVAVLDARLDVAVARYAQAAQDLDELETRIEATSRELDAVRTQLAIAEQQLGMRAEALYKQGSVSLLDVLVSTGSFEELLARAQYIRHVGRSDADIVASVSDFRDRLQQARDRLRDDRTRAERATATRADQRARIEAVLLERRQMLTGVRAEVEDLRTAAAAKAAAGTAVSVTPSPSSSPGAEQGQGTWWPLIQKVAADDGISAQGLYRLMMVESGGVATATNGPYRGLFQYSTSAWRGEWNPWRGRDIFDGAAQIKATGLAIRLGHGPAWWPNTYGWAFSS
jgi:hypothetical protein